MDKNTENLAFTAKVISLYRITIPSVTRAILGIEEGDIIEFEIKKLIKKQEATASV